MESRTLPGLRLDPNAAPVPFDDLFANGKPNAGAGIFAAGMQALKDQKDSLEILGINADAVIFY